MNTSIIHYSDVNNLCEWVLNAREEYEKHAMFGQSAVEHHEEPEFEGTVTKHKGSSSMSKLWITFSEVQLYEADRAILESNHSWLNYNIINATQCLPLKASMVEKNLFKF
ncbi:hypothetical protein EMCRGX_G006693 [Ephydatia muelleri]